MKKLIAITATFSGMLLLVLPRYILPACEYKGYPAMHCTDTARSEYILGALLIVLGGTTFFMKQARLLLSASLGALAMLTAAFVMPEIYGFCRSPQMPCNYGMVPGIKFIAVSGVILMVIAGGALARKTFRKGSL